MKNEKELYIVRSIDNNYKYVARAESREEAINLVSKVNEAIGKDSKDYWIVDVADNENGRVLEPMENKYKVEETKFGTKTIHPAYGTLVFNRAQCGGAGKGRALFGSSIRHHNIITMELYHADITRGLNRDWIHGNDLIISAEMSYSQFAEAITSFGMGTGVPVTFLYTEKDGRLPECNFENKREQFTKEFSNTVGKAYESSKSLIKDLEDLFSQKKSFTKADKENILSKLNQINSNIGSNMEFVAEQFNEQMDKTVREAKGEVEAFCQNKITSIANAAIAEKKEEILQLDNPVDIED